MAVRYRVSDTPLARAARSTAASRSANGFLSTLFVLTAGVSHTTHRLSSVLHSLFVWADGPVCLSGRAGYHPGMSGTRKSRATGNTDRSLANLRPWKPGESGNPSGRPKG